MKLSIIVPVLNSHEIVRRQLLHFGKMNLSDDVEIIYVDDGSEPPIEITSPVRHFTLIRTNDFRPWTWALARNRGAKEAKGNYLLMTDLDYIIPKVSIETALAFNGDYMGFRREFGILDEDGNFSQDLDKLVEYGFPRERYEGRHFDMPAHPNNFVVRKDLFFAMGCYREDLVEKEYPQGEDGDWKKRRKQWERAGKLVESSLRPTLYMFPNGKWCKGGDVDTNPFGLFHSLTRKTTRNHWYVNG